MMNDVIQKIGIPALMCLMCFYYGWKMYFLHDYKAIVVRGTKVKNEEMFCREGGKIVFGFGLASLAAGILFLFDVIAGLLLLTAAFLTVAVLWKRMAQKYE